MSHSSLPSPQRAPRTVDRCPLPSSTVPGDAKNLLLDFLSSYLGVNIFGVQAGFKNHPDCYLFEGPLGTTMAVPTNVMLLDQTSALAIIEEKISIKRKAFESPHEPR